MRLSPLCLAISLTLLAGCQQPKHRAELDQGAATPAASVNPGEVSSVDVGAVVTAEQIGKVSADQTNVQRRERSRVPSEPQAMLARPVAPPPPAVHGIADNAAAAMTNTENYQEHADNPIQLVSENPVSTFSIDVDTGSYSNVRRMLLAGQRPPGDAVRAEEMINYFDYGYPTPADRSVPFKVSTEIAPAPWNPRHQLLQVGIQGYRVAPSEIPAANLVFLIDTSGSMQDEDKLPLLKKSFAALARQMRPQDRVSIVVYAGSAGLVLPPTPGNQQDLILDALDRLSAGGSTNGGEGLQLAYAMARSAFLAKGVNRVILATDGDFNVGTVDQNALETLVADQRKSGIALTTLGFGTGNYNDAMAEQLADIGDGNHAYIDSLNEGRKVLVEELSSTMLTIAQDVKIQVEFNPSVVAEYRLIGYENRALRREDFNNDKVDAGEIGAGHDVTALYEIALVNSGAGRVDPLRYGKKAEARIKGDEIALLRLRYKKPGRSSSVLTETPVRLGEIRSQPSERLRWSAAVAAYADLLRGGKNVGAFSWDGVRNLAAKSGGKDPWGYRAEFLDLVDRARRLTGDGAPVALSE